MFTFVSKLWPGNSSDRHSTQQSGLLFQKELSNVYCDAVVLKYPPESTHASTTESDLISDNNNLAKEEIVACVCIYSILDYATNFASKNGLSEDRDIFSIIRNFLTQST